MVFRSEYHKASWGDWDSLPLIDFGIKLLNTIPSKRLNLAHLPTKELGKFRTTTEESNLSISPLQILRGFGVLHLLADGKCKIKLAELIAKALFGFNIPQWQTIDQELAELYTIYLKPFSKGVIQVHIEENQLLKLDNELIEQVERYYGSSKQNIKCEVMTPIDWEDSKEINLMQPTCFQLDPDGRTLAKEMNKKVKKATAGILKNVIRYDIAPQWQARLTLLTAYDSTFCWKPPAAVISMKIFFYESCIQPCTRSTIMAYRCDGLFRTCVTSSEVRVLELNSDVESLKMYVIQPAVPFSKVFLKKLTSYQLQHYIDEMPTEPEQTSVIIPCFSIISPIGLRSVFSPCKPLHHYFLSKKHPQYPYPCMARIFSPHKAEFGKIYGKYSQQYYGTSFIYPLWDYYHKTKMTFNIERRKLKKEPEEDVQPITYEQQTIKDEILEKSELLNITGKMILLGNPLLHHVQYMVGILKDQKNTSAEGSRHLRKLLASIRSKKKTTKGREKRTLKRQGSIEDAVDAPKAATAKYVISKDIVGETMEEKEVLESTDSKEYHVTKNKNAGHLTKSRGSSSECLGPRFSSKVVEKTQLSKSLEGSRRVSAGTDDKVQQTQSFTSSDRTPSAKIDNLASNISKKPKANYASVQDTEVPFSEKEHTVVVESDEAPPINPYFVQDETAVEDVKAEIMLNTPFLYMIVSKAENGRNFVVSMGRFTNIQETNPPMDVLTTDTKPLGFNANRDFNENFIPTCSFNE